jgi:GNAT superfamily N-acetyltransferase
MTRRDGTGWIRRATSSDSLNHLVEPAFTRATSARGGRALLEQLWGSDLDATGVKAAIDDEVAAGNVWVALSDQEIVAGALVGERCVKVIWVQPAHRRHRVASTLLTHLFSLDTPPLDAWALPGDRATKSLYESLGWKARLLTMRDA